MVLIFGRHDLGAAVRGELGRRYFTWLAITPIFLIAVIFDGYVGAAIWLAFVLLLFHEYRRTVQLHANYAAVLFALILITLAIATKAPFLYFALPGACLLILTVVPILTGRIDDLYGQMSLAGRGYLYLVWTLGHWIMLREQAGPGLALVAGIGPAMSDVMQFAVGKLIGRHIISPNIHPRKAWEGLLGDLLGAAIVVWIFGFAIPERYTPVDRAVLVILIALGSSWGDLISSLVKRVAGAKDWGTALPGHGGLLDRANSLVIAMPLAYYHYVLVLYLHP